MNQTTEPAAADVRKLAAKLLPDLPATTAEDPARAVIRLRRDAAETLKAIHFAVCVMYGRPMSPNAIVRAALDGLGRKALEALNDKARQEPLLRDLAKAAARRPYKQQRARRQAAEGAHDVPA